MTVDEALDELYGAPLGSFVAERTRLAKVLGGNEGKNLAKLRKPSAAASILNQLARHNRRDVDLLLDAGHRLCQAQAGILRGEERDTFEGARRTENDAITRLVKAAETLGASAAVLTKVNQALRAAAITEAGRTGLALGRFTEPPTTSGFEAFAGIEVPPRTRKKPAPKKQDPEERRRQAAAALRDLEGQLHEAERAAQRAQADVDTLAAKVDAAHRRLQDTSG